MTQETKYALAQIGAHVKIQESVVIDEGVAGQIRIGYRSNIKTGVILKTMDGIIDIGARVTIGEYCYLAGHGGLVIGDNTIIAPHCCISAAEHIFNNLDVPIRFQGEKAIGIHIGSDVWIGARAVVLDGVSIGTGCVIGAGSVVTKSLPDYAVAVGVPCKVLRFRNQNVIVRRKD